MNVHEFLSRVLSDEGYIMLATPNLPPRKGYQHVALDTPAAALQVASRWREQGKNIFFALGTFKKPKVWNAAKKNKKGEVVGGWEYRVAHNVLHVRALFLDIDVKQDDEHHHTFEEVIGVLRGMCVQIGLPKPMVVLTGGGMHVYWPLTDAVLPEEWVPVAEKLKAVCGHVGLRADHGVTADCARVLRLPGSFNVKYDPPRKVAMLSEADGVSLATLDAALTRFVHNEGVTVARVKRTKAFAGGRPAGPVAALTGVAGNLGATNDPSNLGAISFNCSFIGEQVAMRGALATEPQWWFSLGVAKFCDPQEEALLAVSDGYPGFEPAELHEKIAHWTGGPPTCAAIHSTVYKDTASSPCLSCPHWGHITTPLQLGRIVVEAEPPKALLLDTAIGMTELPIPKPPEPYKRTTKQGKVRVVIEAETGDGRKEEIVISPYDIYPVRILRQTDTDVKEQSVWRMHLPNLAEPADVTVPLSLITDVRKLHAFMMEKGLHITPEQARNLQLYMTAYIKRLAEETERAKSYDRLGWHDERKTFVMPDRTFHASKDVFPHDPSRNVKAVTKGAFEAKGDFKLWYEAMRFYAEPGKEPYMMFPLASLAAPLLHMTGYKGLLIGATGDTGLGKTTALEAAASIWGAPDAQIVSGSKQGATVNALYNHIGTLHSLPMFWDETTERETDEMREFLLNIDKGRGKERMYGNEHDGKVQTWETIVLSSANTDDISRLLVSGRDSNPHLMRLVSVDFDGVDTSTTAKHRADDFRLAIHTHYGHVGPLYIRTVVENYDKIKRRVLANLRRIETELKVSSSERFWLAAVACCFTAAEIIQRLNLMPVDPAAMLEWMKEHVGRLRQAVEDAQTSPEQIIAGFLDDHQGHSLVLSAKSSSNLDNIAKTPQGALTIRVEFDHGLIYVSRFAIMEYCAKVKLNFRNLEKSLIKSGALVSRNVQKVLGADTPYAKGQVRCWKLDDAKLGTIRQTIASQIAGPAPTTNITPLRRVK